MIETRVANAYHFQIHQDVKGNHLMTGNSPPPDSAPARPRLASADLVVLGILAVAGLGLWLGAASQGDGEAWDHDVFWSWVLPVMAALSGAAGWLRPGAARYVGLALVAPQAIALFATSGFSPLAIVGVIFFIVFAVVFTGIAIIVATVRARFNR